jgi:DNA invertase Pin-like site-specific DNA recombinase/uncharacterized protein YbjQ (UPF0145 family)
MSTPLCISYIRFSSERQSQGSSLERQLKLSHDYAAKHGYVIDDNHSYRDLGVSAYTGKNAKFGDLFRFLTAIKCGEIPRGSILLVESLDRLSRESVLEAFAQFQDILKEDIKVVTLTDGKEYTKEGLNDNFTDLIISLSVMMRANEESKIKSKRIREGYEKKRNNLSNKKMTANVPTWLKLIKEANSFELVPERVEVVKQIFQMSYDGQGIITIARQLNKSKFPAFRSSEGWCQSTVRKILSSRSVVGEYQPHIFRKGMKKPEPVGDVAIDYFPAIIDKDVFYAVQARLSNGTHLAGRTAKIQNLFGGMTKCGYCGATMDVVTKGKFPKDIRYLVCTRARKGVGCSYVSFKCNEVETAFLTFCKEKELLDVLNLEGERDKQTQKSLSCQLSAKAGELLSINNKIRILDEQIVSTEDKLARQHYEESLIELLHIKKDINNAVAELCREIANINLTLEDVDTRVNNILDTVRCIEESSNEEDRIIFRIKLRNNFRQIVNRVVIYPTGIVYSEEQIKKVMQKYDTLISNSSDIYRDMFLQDRNDQVENMRNSQKNTKDDRYFEVHFKNGNFRRINYSKKDDVFKVSFDRVGNRVDWMMGNKQMKTRIWVDLEQQIIEEVEEEVEYYKKKHPDMGPEQAEEIKKWLIDQYSQDSSDTDDETPHTEE